MIDVEKILEIAEMIRHRRAQGKSALREKSADCADAEDEEVFIIELRIKKAKAKEVRNGKVSKVI